MNDLIGGVPVSVAYCDLTDCVRIYTDPQGSARRSTSRWPGCRDGEMVVKLDGVLYLHKSGTPVKPGAGSTPIPYDLLTPLRTTWREWSHARHPGSDVYVGGRPNGGNGKPAPGTFSTGSISGGAP